MAKLGGNKAFQTFANDYKPEDAGGFKKASNLYEKYHSWTAKQYREKVNSMQTIRSPVANDDT